MDYLHVKCRENELVLLKYAAIKVRSHPNLLRSPFSRRCGRACPLPHWGPGIPTQDVGNILVASQKMFPLKCIWRCGQTLPQAWSSLCVCGWCCKSVTIASWRPESFHTLTTIHRSQNPHGDRAEKHSERERLPLQCCTYQCHVYLHYSRGLGPRSTPLCWLFQYTLQKTQTEAPTQNYLNPSVSR